MFGRARSRSAVSGTFNVASGTADRIRNVMETLRDLINPKLALGFGERPIAENPPNLLADVVRFQSATGWRARTPLVEGLRRTVEWHRREQA